MEKARKQQSEDRLKEAILNDPARAIRVGIRRSEERAAEESKARRLNAPKSIEEKVLFHNSI